MDYFIVACDVGTSNLGFAFWGSDLRLLDFVTFCPKSRKIDGKLIEIFEFCGRFTSKNFVYERPVFNKGFRFAASLSEAVGVLKVAFAKSKITSYTSTEVKKCLTGNGRADKNDILRAVEQIYREDFLGSSNHAVDAVAIGHTFISKNKP